MQLLNINVKDIATVPTYNISSKGITGQQYGDWTIKLLLALNN